MNASTEKFAGINLLPWNVKSPAGRWLSSRQQAAGCRPERSSQPLPGRPLCVIYLVAGKGSAALPAAAAGICQVARAGAGGAAWPALCVGLCRGAQSSRPTHGSGCDLEQPSDLEKSASRSELACLTAFPSLLLWIRFKPRCSLIFSPGVATLVLFLPAHC